MEKKLTLKWYIYSNEIASEERYCHNCGGKVIFQDSLKRRQNANGKNIFYFAIYKCPKGHSWNKSIDKFKAISGLVNQPEEHAHQQSEYEKLNIRRLKEEGIEEIEILLEVMEDSTRIDKFLSYKIADLSRGDVMELIKNGFIKVNNLEVKANKLLKGKDTITYNIQ